MASYTNLVRSRGCPKCWSSLPEKEIAVFLTELGVDFSLRDRKELSGKELDFFLPQHSLAIEHGGLHWHCDFTVGKHYHLDKLEQCLEKDLSLMTIFGDEWATRSHIVKNMISTRLGCNKAIQNWDVLKTNDSTAVEFFASNSLERYTKTQHNFCLIEENVALAVVSVKGVQVQVATKIGYCLTTKQLVAALFSIMERLNISETLLTVDRRYSEGIELLKHGFEHVGTNSVTFTYVKNDKRYETFENLKHPYFKIYDCGMQLYKLKAKNGTSDNCNDYRHS